MAAPTAAPEGADVLAAAVRRLVEAVIRTQVGPDRVRAAAVAVEAVTDELTTELRSGPYSPDRSDPFANPLSLVVGAVHPLAPPVKLTTGPDGAQGRFRLGWVYEGPPGLAHGGVLSLVLDHLLGQAVLAAGHGGMTLSLECSYVAPTPLHVDLVADARVERVDGRKVHVVGSIRTADTVTVRARGLFLALDQRTAASLFPHLAVD